MNQHLNRWLDAYLDGELNESQQTWVEDHLASCPQCQSLLAQRRSLSSLLRSAPSANVQKPASQFVSEVRLRAGLRYRRATTTAQPIVTWPSVWQYFPLALLLSWAFIQSVSIVSILVALIPGFNQVLEQTASGLGPPFALSWLEEASLNGLSLANLKVFLPVDLFSWSWIASLTIVSIGALIYLGWLAAWWALARQENHTKINLGAT